MACLHLIKKGGSRKLVLIRFSKNLKWCWLFWCHSNKRGAFHLGRCLCFITWFISQHKKPCIMCSIALKSAQLWSELTSFHHYFRRLIVFTLHSNSKLFFPYNKSTLLDTELIHLSSQKPPDFSNLDVFMLQIPDWRKYRNSAAVSQKLSIKEYPITSRTWLRCILTIFLHLILFITIKSDHKRHLKHGLLSPL